MEKDDDKWRVCDAHCHLIDYNDMDEIGDVLGRAKTAGIELIIENATSNKTFSRVLDIYQKFPDMIVPSIGYHPWYLKDMPADWDKE